MNDEHAKLTAEYNVILKHLDGAEHRNAGEAIGTLLAAARHILKRLGPPDAMDAADLDEMRDALERQTSGAA